MLGLFQVLQFEISESFINYQMFVVKSCDRNKQTRLTLKTVQSNSISKTHTAIRFNLLHFWPSVPSFVFAVLLKYTVTVLRVYFSL